MYTAISRCAPRIMVTMGWGCDVPQGEIGLYMKRTGEPVEFAVYSPIEIEGSQLTFQFDDLLFSKKKGVYEGRLMVGATQRGKLHFMYTDDTQVLGVENV